MNLSDFYTQNYLTPTNGNPQIVEEKTETPIKDESPKNKKFMKKTNKTKNESFDSLYQSILHEADEYGFEGDEFSDDSAGFEDGAEDTFGDDTVTVSRSALEDLKAQIDALLGGTEDFDDAEEYDSEFDYESEDELGDDVPRESWDGKLSPQPKSNLVKDNGDVNFDQELDFDPTEDNDGPVHTGPQGNFDGKLSPQKKSDLFGGNGNANFGKA